MDIPAEITAKVQRLLDGQVRKILAAEGNHLALGHEARQLVLAGRAELAELDPGDLSADGRGQVVHGHDALGKEVRVRGVGILAVLDVLKGLERGVLLGAVPAWEVVGVLSSRSLVSGWSDGSTRESLSALHTLAAACPFSPASAAGSNLPATNSLYWPLTDWSLRAETSGTVMVSTSTAEGAIVMVLLIWVFGGAGFPIQPGLWKSFTSKGLASRRFINSQND